MKEQHSGVDDDDKFLRVTQAAKILHVSVSLLNKLRVVGGGPNYMRLGKAIRYTETDIRNWAQSQRYQNTSQYK